MPTGLVRAGTRVFVSFLITRLQVSTFLTIQNQHFVSTETCPEIASSVGTNFMFGLPTKNRVIYDHIYVHITSMSNNPAQVRITAPFNNYDRQFTVSNATIVALNESLIQTVEGRQFKGIEVFSDRNISVSVLAYWGSRDTDGFLVLPTSALSTRYIAASYQPYSTYNNSILVVGAENNSDVFIKYKTAGSSFTFQNVTLQKFQTFQVLANYDISGAVIVSNKPVAVLSGSYYSQIPMGIGQQNFIVEQMIPTRYWVTQFIVPPIFPHNFYIIRLFTDEDNTEIHCYNHTHHFSVYLDQGSMHEVMFGSDPAVIESNKPISVIQYLADTENLYGNPFMTTVQGMSQFMNSYEFITDNAVSHNPTLALTVSNHTLSSLLLNGRNISLWNPKLLTVSKPLNNYTTVFINISYNSMYELKHINDEKFGATIYGLLNNNYAYGYPLQLLLSSSDILTVAKTITRCGNETATTALETTTHGNLDTTTREDNIQSSGNRTWCMDCDNMLHLQFCNEVIRCHSDEVCFVQSYTRGPHIHMYRSGCMARSKCHIKENLVDCQECCEGDFCNTAGCGDTGLPDRQERGPMCFDCSHQGGNDTCEAVQMCRSDQACKIEKYQWGNGYHYGTGCTDLTACTSKRYVYSRSLLTRFVPVCSRCCNVDFCNKDCISHNAPDLIG